MNELQEKFDLEYKKLGFNLEFRLNPNNLYKSFINNKKLYRNLISPKIYNIYLGVIYDIIKINIF